MELLYDHAFGNLVFTKDGSFKCPICKGLTPKQRQLKHGEKILCSECGSEFKKDVCHSSHGKPYHGVRFVIYGPKFHVTLVMSTVDHNNPR